MNTEDEQDLEDQIAQWRAYMRRRRELADTDGEELEDHLRGQITDLTEAGLRTDESFLSRQANGQLRRAFARVRPGTL